jgi:hypothetical protein
VSEAQVTVGYLARRANTYGGHWDTGGGVGEPRGVVVGRSAVGVAEMGGGGGENRQWLGLGKQNTGCLTINRNIMTRQKIQAKNGLRNFCLQKTVDKRIFFKF